MFDPPNQLKTLDSGSGPEWRLSGSAFYAIPVATDASATKVTTAPHCHSGGNRSPESFVRFLDKLIKDSGLRIQSGVAIERVRD